MKKPIYLLVAAAVVIAVATVGAFKLAKSSPAKASTAAKTPGIAVNLIACGNAQSGVECIALYKGQCAVFAFDPSSGKLLGAQPVASKYCAQP